MPLELANNFNITPQIESVESVFGPGAVPIIGAPETMDAPKATTRAMTNEKRMICVVNLSVLMFCFVDVVGGILVLDGVGYLYSKKEAEQMLYSRFTFHNC